MKTERFFTPLTAISLSLLMYFSSLGFGFNMDDNIVLEHPSVQNQSLIQAFTQPYHSAPDGSQSYGYRPISTLSFALQSMLVGSNAGWGHAINLALFCLIIWRLFAWAKYWLPSVDPKTTWFFIALFAVHPLHVETVVSIKNRDELLSLLFAIESGLAIARLSSLWSWRDIGLSTLFATLAMGAKLSAFPTLMTFALATPLVLNFSPRRSIIIALCLGLPGLWLGYDATTYLAFCFGPLAFALMGLSTQNDWKHIWSFKGKTLSSGLVYNIAGLSAFLAFVAFENSLYLVVSFVLFSCSHLGRLYAIGAALIAAAWIGNQAQLHLWALIYWAWIGINSANSSSKKFVFFALIGTLLSLVIQTQYWINILYLIPLFVYWVTLRYKPNWSVILFSGVALISLAFNLESVVAWIFILHVGHWAISKWQPQRITHLFAAVYVTLGLVFALQGNLPLPSHLYEQQIEKNSAITTNVALSEGRALERIENPLTPQSSTFEVWATAANTMGHYAESFVYPLKLRFYYGLGVFEQGSWKDTSTWAFALLHLGLAICTLVFWKRNPTLSLGLSLYLGGVFLFSNAAAWVAGVAGDRLVFQASLGACLALVSVVPKWDSTWTKAAGIIIILGLIIGYQRVQLWKDPITLMRHDTQLQPPSGQGHYLLAMALMQQAQSESPEAAVNMKREAQSHFQVALSVDSSYWNARVDLSRSYAETGNFEECLRELLIAKAQKPNNEVVWRELCLVYYDLKRAESCLQAVSRYLELHRSPDENILEIQAFLVYSFRNREKGMQLAQEALQYFPNNPNLKAISQGIMPAATAQ